MTANPVPSLVRNERSKLTAAYLNMAAGGLFTAGAVASLGAAVFGLANAAGSLSMSTLVVGIAISSLASGALHLAARTVLWGFQP